MYVYTHRYAIKFTGSTLTAMLSDQIVIIVTQMVRRAAA